MDASRTPFDEPDSSSKSESAAHEPSSATRIFGAVSPRPAQPAEGDLLRSPLRKEGAPASPTPPASPYPVSQTQEWPTAAPPAPPTNQQPSPGPGGFTQMLQALSNPPPAATPSAQPASPIPPKSPSDLASLFTKISVEKSPLPDPPVQPSAQNPGEFTRMLRSLGNPAEQSASKAHAPPAVEAAGAVSGPGSFTQMFNAISAKPGESTEAAPTPRTSVPDPLQPAKQEATASTSSESVPPAQGGFTQLLRALHQEQAPPGKPAEPLMPAPPAASNPAAGGFTQLLHSLSAEPVPPLTGQPPHAHPPAAPSIKPVFSAPPPVGGPGEFTRVIHGLALRDLQGQGAAPVPPVAAAPARPGLPPMQMSQAPAFPQAPAMPQIPHAGAVAPPAMPQFQPAPFAFPPAPAPPPPPAPVPAASKLQQYLPLMLVLNVFALLVVVLIVIFLLQHR